MDQRFEEQAYDSACMTMGEAVWQLVTTGILVTQDGIANMILVLSERQPDLAESIALLVLTGTGNEL